LCICFVQKPFLLVNTQIHITKRPDFYLCICKILFVPQIKVPRGTFICATIEFYKYTVAKSLLVVTPEIAEIRYLCQRGTFLKHTNPLFHTAVHLRCRPICRCHGRSWRHLGCCQHCHCRHRCCHHCCHLVAGTIAVFAAAIAAALLLIVVCPSAASVSACHHRYLPPPLLLLSAGAIATVAAAATAAPVPSAATAAYFSVAGSAASMFSPSLPLFPSPPCHRFCF
jgi:hypothetical protein